MKECVTGECATAAGGGVCVPCLTYHGRLDETPGVALRHVGLEDARRAPGLVHAPEHVDLPPAHGGGCRMDRLRQRRHRFPLVGDGIVPEEGKQGKEEDV